jgi:hypothetical protein
VTDFRFIRFRKNRVLGVLDNHHHYYHPSIESQKKNKAVTRSNTEQGSIFFSKAFIYSILEKESVG